MGNETNSKSKELPLLPDYITFEILQEYIGITDIKLFRNYLYNIFMDISIYDVKQNKKLLKKTSFYDYMKLPIFICEKLFNSFDLNNDNYLEEKEFINGLSKLYCGTFYETSEIIFNLLDYDKDGQIQKDDVTIMLSYLPLSKNENDNEILEEKQKNSRKEIDEIIHKTFSKYNGILKLKQFVDVVINKKSDVFLELICYFYQMKPFTNENIFLMKDIKNNENDDEYKNLKCINDNNNNDNIVKIKLSKKKSGLSPVENFFKKYSFNYENKDDCIQKKDKIYDYYIKRVYIYNHVDMIRLNNENCILRKFDKNNKSDNLLKESIIYKKGNYSSPFKYSLREQKMKNINTNLKSINNDKKLNKQHSYNNITKNLNNYHEFNEKENKVIYENWLYKIIENNLIRKFYIVLANEDIYYYDDKEKTKFLGMHHLIGCIIKEPSINDFLEIDNIKFYSFSITFNNKSKIRKYYSPNFQIVNQFTQNLKKGIGYIHFNDYYEIENKIIGKGKFGVVNLGIDKKTGNKVAIKIINKSSLKTEIDKELIKSEIDIMKLCHHPNIVKLLDHFENSEYIYIVMEYISGGTLNQYIKSHYFYISESEAANIILQIGNGLKYLHNYGIVHRDLKTDNIMLTKNNENGIIKIMDFGLSKVVGPNEGLIDGYGTLNYCAPEVLMREPYNKQIDIWSLGIILFYMLVGHFPFQGNNEEIIAKKIVYQPLKFDEKEWENKSKKVINLIEKSLEKKPNKRINIDDFLKHPWIKKNLKQKMSL